MRLLFLLGMLGAPADGVDYLKDVRPVLAAKCYACHGALQQKGGLRLDTVQFMLEGGDRGPVLIAGKSDMSSLIDRVLGRNGARRMPPAMDGEPLAEKQIALFKAWIDQGAKAPANEKPEADPREHWAFRAPVRPAVPKVNMAGGNPIDVFIAAGLAKQGLTPQRPTDKRLLPRRVYLDLIGLPPTLQEQEAFLKDTSADAYEKVVDKLLASPQYGERWARHWMDIWRYSDWWGLGQEVRNSQKHIWHWRDWIIDSLNADKGYDQMLREMLAADELYPNDLERLRATGFLVRHYFIFNRTTWLDETIEHTSKAFLGLTLNCTKCHDHKYDPFSQPDYYRFRAFFEPYQVRTEQVPGEADYTKDGIPRVYDANLETPTYLHIRGDDRNPAKERPLAPGLPTVLTWAKLDIQPVKLPVEAHTPGLRPHVVETQVRLAKKQIEAARLELGKAKEVDSAKSLPEGMAKAALQSAEKALAAAEAQLPAIEARAAADRAKFQGTPAESVSELARQAARSERRADVAKAEADLAQAELAILRKEKNKKVDPEKNRAAAQAALDKARKALEAPGEVYTPLRGAVKAPESNLETEASRQKPFPATSTGRRSALAKWLTDPHHPLTARVAVNHIWGRHFGRPLVATVFDFGRKGAPPTHPELLDFLAVELMEKKWSMKHLHRLMVTSNLYRLSSSNAEAGTNLAKDPENRFFWRMNPVRMEAQVVRDSLLHLAGDLDGKIGGASIPVAQDSKRRSIYFVHSNNDQQKFLSIFDDASVRECYRRSESIVPQQALTLSNSQLALTAAQKIAVRLEQKSPKASDAEFIQAAFQLILAGSPTREELAECQEALSEFRRLVPNAAQAQSRARANLVHALLNHNDFITVR